MTGTVTNLRLARKARKRRDAEQAAAQNRALHGQTSHARETQATEKARAARDLAGKQREPGN